MIEPTHKIEVWDFTGEPVEGAETLPHGTQVYARELCPRCDWPKDSEELDAYDGVCSNCWEAAR